MLHILRCRNIEQPPDCCVTFVCISSVSYYFRHAKLTHMGLRNSDGRVIKTLSPTFCNIHRSSRGASRGPFQSVPRRPRVQFKVHLLIVSPVQSHWTPERGHYLGGLWSVETGIRWRHIRLRIHYAITQSQIKNRFSLGKIGSDSMIILGCKKKCHNN